MARRVTGALIHLAVQLVFMFLIQGLSYAADDDLEKAKLHYKQGVILFKEENYPAALVEFKASFDASPNWKLHYNIGLTYQALHRFVDAEASFKAYLAEGGDEIPDDRVEKVQDLLEQLANVIGSLAIDCDAEGAEVFIDGELVGRTPLDQPLRLSVGLYSVEVRLTGSPSFKKAVELAGKETMVLKVSFGKDEEDEQKGKAAAGEGKVKTKPGPAKPATGAEPKGRSRKIAPTAFYAMVGVTGAMIVGAAVTGGLAMKAHEDLGDTPEEEWKKRNDLIDRGRSLALTTDVIIGVGAASAVAMTVLAFFSDFKRKEKPSGTASPSKSAWSPAVGPGYAGMMMTF